MDIDVYPENKNLFNLQNSLIRELTDSDNVVKLGTYAAKIAYYNFQWRFITILIYNTMINIGVESFLMTYNHTVTLKFGKWTPQHKVHIPQFAVFGQDTTELSDTLKWLVENGYKNTGRFIVVCANKEKCNENELFQTLSRNHIVNVVFLKTSENSTEPMAFSYYPIVPGNCKNYKPYAINLSRCNNGSCFKQLYPEKLKNLHKCPFVVSTLEQPPFMHLTSGVNGTLEPSGADGEIIKFLSEILNGTLEVKTPVNGEWGHFENNNWTGSFGHLFNRRAHVSLCSAPLTPQLQGNFQISFTYSSIDIVWAARLPSPKPFYAKLLYPMKIKTRIALIVIFIIILMVQVFMKTELWKNVGRVLKIRPTNISLCFYSCWVFLGMPLLRIPSKGTLRAIVVSWIWFSYIIRTAYQAALVGTLKKEFYKKYLESFEEVIENKYPYGGLETLRDYYSEDPHIVAGWKNVKLSEAFDILDGLFNGSSDFVIALNKEYILHHLMRNNATSMLVQILPDKIVNSPAVLYFRKYHPIRLPVTHILGQMVEGGFIDGIYSHYLSRTNYLLKHRSITPAKPLSIRNIGVALAIITIGWYISTFVFFLELIVNKLRKKCFK